MRSSFNFISIFVRRSESLPESNQLASGFIITAIKNSVFHNFTINYAPNIDLMTIGTGQITTLEFT